MKKRLGFSLLELIIVIVIIGIIVSIALAQYNNVVEKARSAEAYFMLAQIVAAENRYYLENNNSYTATLTNLDIFQSNPASSNFTFSIGSTDASSGYAEAARRCPAGCGNRMSYGMCLKTGKQAPCGAGSCNPGCP